MTPSNDLLARIEASLESLRPYLIADGGNIELVDVTEDNVVRVRLLGNCVTCPMSFMTMKAGVEETIKKIMPELVRVEAVNLSDQTIQL